MPNLPTVSRLNELGIDRLARLAGDISQQAKVLEIGGSYNPIIRRSAGYNSFAMDYAPREELAKRYAEFGTIEEVDFVCTDGDIERALGREHLGTFDYCLSSHSIEHLPNPIRSLQAIEKALKATGVLRMAVPDKRGCFDFFRPITTTGAWIEAFETNATRHSVRALFDTTAYPAHKNKSIMWGQDQPMNDLALLDDVTTALAKATERTDAYQDAHAWVFTPSSFALVILELHALGLIDFTPAKMVSDGGVEFYVDMVRDEGAAPISRDQRTALLRRIAIEQADALARVA